MVYLRSGSDDVCVRTGSRGPLTAGGEKSDDTRRAITRPYHWTRTRAPRRACRDNVNGARSGERLTVPDVPVARVPAIRRPARDVARARGAARHATRLGSSMRGGSVRTYVRTHATRTYARVHAASAVFLAHLSRETQPPRRGADSNTLRDALLRISVYQPLAVLLLRLLIFLLLLLFLFLLLLTVFSIVRIFLDL